MAVFPYAKVYRAGSLTVPHNTDTPVPFTSATHDPDGYWDSNTKLIVPTGKGGVPFLILANVFANDQPDPDGNAVIQVNGTPVGSTTFIRNSEQAGGYGLGWMAPAPTIETLADGDEVTLVLWQDSGLHGTNASMHFLYSSLTLLRLSN